MQAGRFLNIRPEIGLRETIWKSDDFHDSTTRRSLFTGKLDVSTQLEKDWHSPLSRWEGIHQILRPTVTLVSIKGSDDNPRSASLFGEPPRDLIFVDHPVFVPPGSTNQSRQRYFAFDNVLQDQSDVIPDQTIIYYTMENQFLAREAGKDGVTRRILRVRTGTGYDTENHQRADSLLEARLEPSDHFALFTDATYNHEKKQIDRFNIGSDVSDNRGDFLKLAYRHSKSFAAGFEEFRGDPDFEGFKQGFDEISELNTNLRLRLLKNVDFLYRSNYSFNVNTFFRQAYSIVYRSRCDCWSANFSVIDRARAGDTQVRFLVNLEGLGSLGNSRNP